MEIDSQLMNKLKEEAKRVSGKAYMPYSQFCVGAALTDRTGKIYSGTNIENASYGLSMCAERSAIFKAVSDGIRDIQVLVIYTPTNQPTVPCGACRQVLTEFSKDTTIISFCDTNENIETTIKELLPNSFGPDSLNK